MLRSIMYFTEGVDIELPGRAPREGRDLIAFILQKADQYRGAFIYPLIITGRQGVGKSRILSTIALQFKKRGFKIHYDITFPRALGFDYVFVDDFAAVLHAVDHSTKEGRIVRKLEILIREIARYGVFYAAPRYSDILKQMRSEAHVLHLYHNRELIDYGINTNCDLVAKYIFPDGLEEEFCVRFSQLTKWGYMSEEWEKLYIAVQKKKRKYIDKYLSELSVDTFI